MKLTNEVRIARSPAEVFDALLDVERVAGCLPGSTLTGRTEENTYAGEVRVKIGPLRAAYSGTVRYLEVDRDAGAVVLKASGKETSGQGNADAHVAVTVRPDGEGTVVSLDTDLMVRGRVAQFGSGVIGEVSERLIDQFAGNVDQLLSGQGDAAAQRPAGGEVGSRAQGQAPPKAEPALDGLALVARPLLKRLAPIAAGVAVGVLIGLALRRRGWRDAGRVALDLSGHAETGHPDRAHPVVMVLLADRT
jgi:carbon monoxide dehydrogenase subunit G